MAKQARESIAASTELVTEDIARMAYFMWQDRGCPDGSPDEDWFRAEETLRQMQGSDQSMMTQRGKAASA